MPRSEAEDRAARHRAFELSYARPVAQRLEHGLIKTFRPGFDDGPPMRSWDSISDYRRWCEDHLEPWLGYCSPEHTRKALEEIDRQASKI
jgi:hypothetical protein